MCGISAVNSEFAALKAIMINSKQLERGTQGSGVAYICKNNINVVKEPISPFDFIEKHLSELTVITNYAIGHNRMPSVGGVCYNNTHPFVSCNRRFALVHNGHCLNGNLRYELIMRGHKIKGETDSELLTHKLEDLYTEKRDMIKALTELLRRHLSGAIAVLGESGIIWVAKAQFAPVYYCTCKNGVYVGSSKTAIESVIKLWHSEDYKIGNLEDDSIMVIKDKRIKVIKVHVERPKIAFDISRWADFIAYDLF